MNADKAATLPAKFAMLLDAARADQIALPFPHPASGTTITEPSRWVITTAATVERGLAAKAARDAGEQWTTWGGQVRLNLDAIIADGRAAYTDLCFALEQWRSSGKREGDAS